MASGGVLIGMRIPCYIDRLIIVFGSDGGNDSLVISYQIVS